MNLKILVANQLWPHRNHTVRAANIVIYELIREMSNVPGVRLGFLNISHENDDVDEADREFSIKSMSACSIDVLDPMVIPQEHDKRSKLARAVNPVQEDFYPDLKWGHLVEKAVSQFNPDMLFVPWTEWVTALCSTVDRPKFAYYGNPDPKSFFFSTKLMKKYGKIDSYRYYAIKLSYRKFTQFHANILRKYEIVGNVAANDVLFYLKHGHPNAFYIQNTWIDRIGPAWKTIRLKAGEEHVNKIIGNIGKLTGTANSYGLEFLGDKILPTLRKVLRGLSYEIHILGAGELEPAIKRKLENPEIIFRGFVPNIDHELLTSKLVLCVNNGSPYKVGHTRYLHAWSLGCCVVAHTDARASMPELEHGENILLGDTGDEITEWVYKALIDRELRMRIGEGGFRTFREHFTADKVAAKIVGKMRDFLRF